jgi:hypothetical protein
LRQTLALLLFALGIGCAQAQPAPLFAQFGAPRPVTIVGYDGHAMEPFVTRDGAVLFFNNRNDPADQTDLHWAERIDDLTFRYRGRVDGANSAALDGVATMSAAGRFCFVSPREYGSTLSTVYCGVWANGRLSPPVLQRHASVRVRGRVVFDVELSAEGEMLVLADGVFRGGPIPAAADLRLARWRDNGFHLAPDGDALLARLNSSGALEYAAALSADTLELAFTRAEGPPPLIRTSLWIARRANASEAFGEPVRIAAISGAVVEAPAFAPDGNALYYHARTGDRFSIWRVSR